jgi:thiosulfate dehydrogenase
MLILTAAFAVPAAAAEPPSAAGAPTDKPAWNVPDIDKLPDDAYGKLVREGRDLIHQTSRFIGPEVKNKKMRYAGNNLACSSCHIEAGTVKFAAPFVGTFADYPQYRPREDGVQTIEGRINGCMERSMNGKPLPEDSHEMLAMTAYMKFMSTGVPVGSELKGRLTPNIKIIDRAADPAKGRLVYETHCMACHGPDGAGLRVGSKGDGLGYVNPPLWGPDSYNTGAGMNRVIQAARFIRYNMPKGATHEAPILNEEDTFDVSAYINSQKRPVKAGLDRDFPDRRGKPADAAFAPYREGFSAEQHKYGPFKPIIEARTKALKTPR